ncbi:hypothetical protein Ae201684P_012514 [Aphanomyces euteiches]|uniref:Uncharacterized protein n=1 Tax=Aphanomyces euteiches TaxID=100861 RepID=A0A6G0W8W4_9STRA|nr:hypothetical protein Ae201684_017579 [Aphanomyces euteiches]KAH9076024.1 hypothetical protein Ae201684P_012514 [Aphanomyces euteiches]
MRIIELLRIFVAAFTQAKARHARRQVQIAEEGKHLASVALGIVSNIGREERLLDKWSMGVCPFASRMASDTEIKVEHFGRRKAQGINRAAAAITEGIGSNWRWDVGTDHVKWSMRLGPLAR